MKRGFAILSFTVALAACTPEMEVSGPWGLFLDPAGTVPVDSLFQAADSLFADTIDLPGTTDLAGKGLVAPEPQYGFPVETGRLTRRFSFVGTTGKMLGLIFVTVDLACVFAQNGVTCVQV